LRCRSRPLVAGSAGVARGPKWRVRSAASLLFRRTASRCSASPLYLRASASDRRPACTARGRVTLRRTSWLTNTALSGARLYWENWGKLGYFNVKGVSIPVAVSVFPDELYPAPRSWTERAFPKLMHFNKLDKGGHFAAWEQPKLFSEELRAGFRPLQWNR
jgi:pimeloyl-ACP methyl ester carboxylesterase